MKNLIVLVILLCAYTVNAQTIIKSTNNTVVGYAEDGNKFYDLTSTRVLDFSTDEQIKNVGGDVEATYDRDNGQVLDAKGDLVLTIDGNNIKGINNQVIASVDSYGVLRDIDSHVLGSVPGADNYFIAYFFLVYSRF